MQMPAREILSLPTDLLTLIFFYLSPKELCVLDSSILNHTYRPLFLSSLVQRFRKESDFIRSKYGKFSLQSETRWYICRGIPITTLSLFDVSCPERMIAMNSNSLKDITFWKATMVDDDTLALGQCSNLKRITFHGCSLPPNSDLTSILQHLTRLEELKLHQVPFSRSTASIISQHCRLLKDLQLSSLNDLGDHELRVLVEGCPSLRSLRLVQLRSITEESVKMLKNRHPQISSIGIRSCQRVRFESVLSLLREITIPTIFLNEDENLQISAVDNFSSCLPSFASTEGGDLIQDLLTHEFLLERMVGLLASRNRVRPRVIDLFRQLVRNGNHDLVVNAGVVPALIHHFEPINEDEVFSSLLLLQTLSSKTNHQHCLLTSGVLSIFRPHRLQLLKVRKPLTEDLEC
jgi:hypothetical protein